MKLCDRCRVSGCLLTYGGKACREARKQECPDVVFTRADKIREMDDEELAVVVMCPHDGDEDSCKGSPGCTDVHQVLSGMAPGTGGGAVMDEKVIYSCVDQEHNTWNCRGAGTSRPSRRTGRWKTAGTSALAAAMRSRWKRSARVPSTTGTVCASFARLSATTV